MSFHLHRAERADTLVDALGTLLAVPLDDPFATEVVSVPTRGVERWLSQRLSLRLGAALGADGICAGVDFPSPHRVVTTALSSVSDASEDDPWEPRRAVWPLLEVIDDVRGESWAALLWAYLGDEERRGRRWSTARHLASLFGRYAATGKGRLGG